MSNNEEDERIGISIDEARKMLGTGINLMLELVKTDGDLKTTESYRNIPMTPRLKEMLLNLKREKMNNLQYGQEWNICTFKYNRHTLCSRKAN